MADTSFGWIRDRISDLAVRMGPGLLGKVTPFFIVMGAVCIIALFQLPLDSKIYAFWLAAACLAIYGFIAGWVVIAHPILGNMDGNDALKYLREASKAKDPAIIQGTARPIANSAPSKGITQGGAD